ncbi:flagellar basal body L-ring protein FlgH [Rhodobaculum claviforme]|uniref:Flagellar L-ring protein n=1 Tax=Rhodobaculum claviforme TaxID=1549854 RepID=A0A934TMW0_9RHOB|nr:flagellar basal body L-ring protein FlgH [Rhodobaculum claviforme]MBK5928479.1 flagellar basal body L-ring protein [Rhodobaculum claviforme]
MRILLLLLMIAATAGCSRLSQVGRAPEFNPLEGGFEHHAMYSLPLPDRTEPRRATDQASLWSAGQRSLLGDRRASRQGDILTVVIEIDDRAEMSNSSATNRSGAEDMAIRALFGLPERINERLPDGATLNPAVAATGSGSFRGDGSVRRNEKLTLRLASTVVEALPNGVVRIEGTQEVRVNNELRELVLTGYVRPEDISRRNEITYDKIAGARISYGGRGIVSDMQRPRWGQQISDIILPF